MRLMTAGGGREIGRAGTMLAGLLCLAIGAGCSLRPSEPENRAVYFVEKLIHEPEAIDDLRAVAIFPDDRGVEGFLSGLPARTALLYLRARARLGADLNLRSSHAVAPEPDRRRVTVSVSEGPAIGVAEPVRFQVELARRDDQWMVTGLTAD